MKQVSHVNNVVGLHDDYGMYGVFTKEQFQVIKLCGTKYPVPAIPKTVVIQPDLVTIYNTYTLTEDYICPTNHS